MPPTTHYCEPFGGSAAVLLNRPASPVETYNDLYSEVVTFFRVLREQKETLIEQIGLTTFSREEFESAITAPTDDISDIERARRFYIMARQVRTGLASKASAGRWAHCLLTSRAGMAGAVSRWLGAVEDLGLIAQRLLRVQIENAPAVEVIQRYDSSETLFYCDPPYPHDARSDNNAYSFEMTGVQHRQLAAVLHKVAGRVAISSYASPLMDELFQGWYLTKGPQKQIPSSKAVRQEVLWTNYDPAKVVQEWQQCLEA